MTIQETFIAEMKQFLSEFNTLYEQHQKQGNHYAQMEKKIEAFTSFILDPQNAFIWEQLDPSLSFMQLVKNIRKVSTACVCAMEKYKARQLQENRHDKAYYFKNIQGCVDHEFDTFKITEKSRALLIGSGAFPMTPLMIAERTGAKVVGIDIDLEAIVLGRGVIDLLDKSNRITIQASLFDQLDFTREATHIIICSIIKEKYRILEQLYALTSDDVVVSIRYGNGIKSLFNFPSQPVDQLQWRLVKNVRKPDNIFDIALYHKDNAA